MLYNIKPAPKTSITVNESYQGYTIEEKIERMINNDDPIEDRTDLIYTEREDGVIPEYNPRTDKMELALEQHDARTKAELAKRAERHSPKTEHKKENSDKAQTSEPEANSATSNTAD